MGYALRRRVRRYVVDGRLSAAIASARSDHSPSYRTGVEASGHRAPCRLRRQHGTASNWSHSKDVSALGRLVCQFQAGETEAFAGLLNQLKGQRRMYSSWVHESSSAEDLDQELCVALWYALKTSPPRVLSQLCD